MEQKNKKGSFWRLFGPLIIYWVVGFAAEVVAEVAILGGKILSEMDYKSMLSMSETEMTSYLNEMIVKMYSVLSQHIMEITAFTALACIPLSLYFIWKDRKEEKLTGAVMMMREPLWKYIAVAGLGVVLCLGLNNILNMVDAVFLDSSYALTGASMYQSSLPMQLLCLGLLSPISEELIYRGLLYKRYREVGGVGRSMMYSAILFGFAHSGSIQFIYALILGAFLAYVYEKYGSLLAPILLHAAANITAVIGTKTDLFTWMMANPLRMGGITVACAFAASCIYVFMRGIESKGPKIEKEALSDN